MAQQHEHLLEAAALMLFSFAHKLKYAWQHKQCNGLLTAGGETVKIKAVSCVRGAERLINKLLYEVYGYEQNRDNNVKWLF